MDKNKRRIKKTFEEKSQGVFVVEGINAVSEYIKFKPESVGFVVYKKGFQKNHDLLKRSEGVKFIEASQYKRAETDQYSKAPIWASVTIKAKEDSEIEALKKLTGSTVLVLDHITDPRNLGAILRTAAFYGIKYVIAAKDRQVLLAQSAVSTAQGAFALCDLIVVTNLSRVIKELKKSGYWAIGTVTDGTPIDSLTNIEKQDNLLLIMGSEEKGMTRLVTNLCDWNVSIDGGCSSLNSLNVSVATGIIVDRIQQKRKKT